MSLHDKPESKAIIEALSKYLPPVVSEVSTTTKGKPKKKAKAAAAKPEAITPAKPATTTASATEDRGPRFDKLDKDHKGKLTLEEYVSRQTDAEAAKERFEKFDANNDGFLTHEEFVTQGGKHPNAK